MTPLVELFSDPKRWTQNRYARNKEGIATPIKDENAVCWCIIGGVYKLYDGPDQLRVEMKIRDVIAKKENSPNPNWISVTEWQDHPNRTLQEVLEVLKEAGV